ncbi:uncharacterized protein [Gossypium hirsutum]|uniref:DDE Tnp4 domain-containing protein n=1 Tax=Gossypium hirsutum TaxID=3635 RepID=A0A1U8L0X5_GOSHI|nr:uncharacterized protein LOC107921710 [Gossypium hirsutum]
MTYRRYWLIKTNGETSFLPCKARGSNLRVHSKFGVTGRSRSSMNQRHFNFHLCPCLLFEYFNLIYVLAKGVVEGSSKKGKNITQGCAKLSVLYSLNHCFVADRRVLRDAISKRHGLKVPHGCYYLVDAGYTNCERFLAFFRGQRYHLNEWRQGYQPSTTEEFFNMKHASARNVIERCFGLLKLRWGILRSPSFYPVRVHNRIIIACCLFHNFIRTYMSLDPIEAELGKGLTSNVIDDDELNIVNIHPSDAWATWRMELANQIFDEWQASRN